MVLTRVQRQGEVISEMTTVKIVCCIVMALATLAIIVTNTICMVAELRVTKIRNCHKCGKAFRQATMHQQVADGKRCWFCHGCWDGRQKRRNG